MFTGLVEGVGEITEVTPTPGGIRLRLQTDLARELAAGDSVAIDGVCLTATLIGADGIHADVSPETARITTLGEAQVGRVVNLERPLRADSRLGGHFVQGHVDAMGTVEELRQEGDSYWLTVSYPPELNACIVRKGSIAVNGVSLTVAGVGDRQFDVQIIPYTWTHTNVHALRSGDRVNLECDILAKYVSRALEVAALAEKVHGTR